MKQFIKYIALIVCACSCWACMDDEMEQQIDYSKPATVKLSIDFSDMQIVTPGTRSAGDAIGKMANVCILFYDASGNLAKDVNGAIYHYATINSSETASFTKTIPAGKYKVVAVANMGNLTTDTKYAAAVQTMEGLKSISLQWNNSTIPANNQMFGFFNLSTGNNSIDDAIGKDGMSKVAPTSYDAPELALSGTKQLFAKLYRTVAKVSVAFDGSGLNSNVFVTINSIRLGNLPKECGLWKENAEITDTLSAKVGGGAPSEILTSENFGILKVTNRGAGDESLFPKDAHSQTGPSLFMFENRQGTTYTKDAKDKTIAKKKYGAFIEIVADYANEQTGSNGKIIYRYMLGEDIPNSFNNYNLTRNRHYKVTLMLQKSGKEEPYWRVDYTENPFISLPTEVNISYRQSAKLDIPFTVVDNILGGVQKVEAKIVENPWYDDLDAEGKREAQMVTSDNRKIRYGFLAWNGFSSNNDYYGSNKEGSVNVVKTGDKYNLSVQTEALGFKSEGGYETADSYTGYNNYSNPRTAKVKVTVNYNSGVTKIAEVKVVQVPRIVNPIAVYRKWNSEKPFKIRLLNALGAEIESYGPWKAEVESGKDWIGIKNETTTTYGTSITSGEAGGVIRFDYKPLAKLSSEGEAPRCGVIVVRFSNYNVEHRIYVRQGDAPMAIGNREESLWTSYNYIGNDANGKSLFTSSPMEEGAWLKSGNSLGILANNTDNTDKFESSSGSFKMSDGTTKPWGAFFVSSSNTDPFNAPGYAMPSLDDLKNLVSLRELSGFGIGYDDNATETVAFNEDAQYTNPAMGRRGIAICDAKGRNLFFPVGKRGYGRRRSDMNGGLHYANSTSQPEGTRPALWDMYKSMGAIYWVSGNQKMSFNYSLSNIELQSTANGVGADACFARLLKGSDIIEFKNYFNLGAKFISGVVEKIYPWNSDYTVSITSSESITGSAIEGDQSFYRVYFKYHKDIDKINNGVIIKAISSNYNITFEKKISIQELEKLESLDTIILETKN